MSRAPIEEALVDIHALAQNPIERAQSRLRDEMRATHPGFETMRSLEGSLTALPGQPPVSTASDKGVWGYVFHSSDSKSLVQFRMDGFTHNRLAPYAGGDALIEEALRCWPLYVTVGAPAEVKRVAMRYINRMKELPRDGFRELLTAPPSPSAGAPGDIDGFSSRTTTSDRDGLESTLKVAFQKAVDGSYTLTLDIEASLRGALGTETKQLRAELDRLRTLKNALFFATITDRAVERYS